MPRKMAISRSAAKDRVPTKITRPQYAAATLHQRCSTRIQVKDLLEGFTSSSEHLSQFAIQLLLDPSIAGVKFVSSLPFLSYEVPINMLVADLHTDQDNRVAFDVVSERQPWDIDSEGLVQLALQHHRIRLAEIDQADIDVEPLADNCKIIWSHRDHVVPIPLETEINRAFTAHRALTVRSLGRIIGVPDPIAEIGALICQGILLTDLSVKLGPTSVLHQASSAWRPPSRFGRTYNRPGKAASR